MLRRARPLRRSSRAACRSFDHIEKRFQIKIHHVHHDKHGIQHGHEPVLHPTKYRPDGYSFHRLKYIPVDDFKENHPPFSPSRVTLWEYFGNEFHGYPPTEEDGCLISLGKNSKEDSFIGLSYDELHRLTFYRLYYISQLGYDINYVWEHEWNEYMHKGSRVPIKKVIHRFSGR